MDAKAVRQVVGQAVYAAQIGDTHVDTKPLKGFEGASVVEIISDHDGDTFRAVYTVKFRGVVYTLHAFQKKSKKGSKTPQKELDLIRQRLKDAEQHDKGHYLYLDFGSGLKQAKSVGLYQGEATPLPFRGWDDPKLGSVITLKCSSAGPQ